MHELEDAGVELERTRSDMSNMEKKCKKVDQIVLEWKSKYDTASNHVESMTLELQKASVSAGLHFLVVKYIPLIDLNFAKFFGYLHFA